MGCHLHATHAALDTVWFGRKDVEVALSEVDAITFSEVMRDVDLVASVAYTGDAVQTSTETLQRRAELVTELIAETGLAGVRCEEQFVHVAGKLASYRIHLGSGNIHIQPGNYLCVLRAQQRDASLYLPFVDTDLRMAEIVSKIYLLMKDDKIKDGSILAQIKKSLQQSGRD